MIDVIEYTGREIVKMQISWETKDGKHHEINIDGEDVIGVTKTADIQATNELLDIGVIAYKPTAARAIRIDFFERFISEDSVRLLNGVP
jgi:hypothetical protein